MKATHHAYGLGNIQVPAFLSDFQTPATSALMDKLCVVPDISPRLQSLEHSRTLLGCLILPRTRPSANLSATDSITFGGANNTPGRSFLYPLL